MRLTVCKDDSDNGLQPGGRTVHRWGFKVNDNDDDVDDDDVEDDDVDDDDVEDDDVEAGVLLGALWQPWQPDLAVWWGSVSTRRRGWVVIPRPTQGEDNYYAEDAENDEEAWDDDDDDAEDGASERLSRDPPTNTWSISPWWRCSCHETRKMMTYAEISLFKPQSGSVLLKKNFIVVLHFQKDDWQYLELPTSVLPTM